MNVLIEREFTEAATKVGSLPTDAREKTSAEEVFNYNSHPASRINTPGPGIFIRPGRRKYFPAIFMRRWFKYSHSTRSRKLSFKRRLAFALHLPLPRGRWRGLLGEELRFPLEPDPGKSVRNPSRSREKGPPCVAKFTRK